MKFDILSVVPELVEGYFGGSVMGRAIEDGKIEVTVHNIRDWTQDKHRTADDEPFGGGAGMVMKVEPIYRALKDLKKENTKVVLFTPRGEQLTQQHVAEFSGSAEHYILICGRYEGVDQRVHEYLVDHRISIGKYVLSGGELPAMVFVDAVSRLVPGVLGSEESLKKDLAETPSTKIFPQFTRPATFTTDDGEEWSIPDVLQSGNHAEIAKWRDENGHTV